MDNRNDTDNSVGVGTGEQLHGGRVDSLAGILLGPEALAESIPPVQNSLSGKEITWPSIFLSTS